MRPGDKPATDPGSHQPYLAATLSFFLSLLQEKSPQFVIAGIPAISEKHPGL